MDEAVSPGLSLRLLPGKTLPEPPRSLAEQRYDTPPWKDPHLGSRRAGQAAGAPEALAATVRPQRPSAGRWGARRRVLPCALLGSYCGNSQHSASSRLSHGALLAEAAVIL